MDPLYFEALAQLETAGGRKTIKGPKGEDSNNLYNIKDFSGKGYKALDKAEGSNDAYRVYPSREAATTDLIGLLSRKYPKALEATDPRSFAESLKAGGYATDPAYVDKFVATYGSLAAQGDHVGVMDAPPAAPAANRSLDALYAAAQGPRPPKQFAMTKTAAAAQKVGNITQEQVTQARADDWFTRATDQQLAARKATEEAAQQSVLDIARAQSMDTALGTLQARLDRPEHRPDGTTVSEEELAGYTVEEQDAIRQANNRAEREYIKFQINDHKDRMIEAGKSGAGWAVLGGLISGTPEGYAVGGLTSFAAARSAYGSVRLANEGRKAAAFASSLAENVGGNVAITGMQDYLSPHIGLQDYVMAGLGGGVGMALHAPRILGAGRRVETDLIKGILDKELESKVRDIETARAAAPADADPRTVAAEANRVQSKRIRATLDEHTAALGPDRKLLSDESVDAITGETPEAATPHIDAASQLAESKGKDFAEASRVRYNEPTFLNARQYHAENSPQWQQDIYKNTNGRTYQAIRDLPPGVHVSPEAAANPDLAPAISTIQSLAGKYLGPESRVYIGDGTAGPWRARGSVISVGDVHMIGLNGRQDGVLHTGIHELGHAIFHEKAKDIPADLLGKIRDDYSQFLGKLLSGDTDGAALQRFAITSPGAHTEPGKLPVNAYTASFDEYVAEQYAKHLTRLSVEGDTRISSDVRRRIIDAVRTIWQFFKDVGDQFRGKGFARPDKGAHEFFSRVLDNALEQAKHEEGLIPTGQATELPAATFHTEFDAPRSDAEVQATHGLDTLPTATASQRARVKALTELYRKAENYPMPDQGRMSWLLQQAPLKAVAPTALKLLQSDNPVARMAASELLESGSGAAGRRTTASIAKWINERAYMGNSLNDFQRHYVTWRNANGGGLREDFLGGEKWTEFNRAVATEIENRKNGRVSDAAPAIHDAADVLEGAYERMRKAQIESKTPGWAALPESSIGYMPHRMSAPKVRDLSPEQARVVHSVLAEQFQQIEGFDQKFSLQLASKYMDIMRKRATAGYSATMAVQSNEAADIVEEAVQAMGMSREEAQAMAQRVLKAAPAHTRSRLKLDLTRTYIADGKPFQLLDIFETDQLSLLRGQAGRVSGETALMRHGIPGSTGLKLIRDSLAFGKAGEKADNATLEAFDQAAAEMLGQPFGEQNGRWMDRALQFNSLASLGGMGFNQLAETLNAATTLGVRHALASVGSFARLRGEILALSKGQKVHNPIIGSLETYGAEFGTDHYKMVFPFDMPDRIAETYGIDTLTAGDRLLRAGTHLQGSLSLWRAITSVQQRGVAEQIVHKALRYIREGNESIALADMGIDKKLSADIKRELARTAKFDERGKLQQFDITKMEDQRTADAFVQAVHRGTAQIIQDKFIGETGKWAHSGFLKLLTQFKTFSIIAIDKQWNRQVGNHGTAKALGMLLGTMSFAAPIYMIRAGIASLGRPDQDAYLKRALHPYEIARQTLNYVALSGLAGDLLDATTAIAGYTPSGGRSGANKSFVGNVVAPVVGKVDDVWGALQNTKDGTDVSALARQLPFSRLPWLVPAVNSLRPEPK